MKDILWTRHSRFKLREYSLSEGRVKRVIHSPDRVERGIAEGTVAMMRKEGSAKNKYEVWVMVVSTDVSRKIISAWKYPGSTKPGEPFPEKILTEMEDALSDVL